MSILTHLCGGIFLKDKFLDIKLLCQGVKKMYTQCEYTQNYRTGYLNMTMMVKIMFFCHTKNRMYNFDR